MIEPRTVSTFLACCLVAIVAGKTIAQDETRSMDQRARNALVRVVTVSQEGLQDEKPESRLAAALTRLDRAASFHPNIACLPESFTRGEPETVPGPTTERMAKWAADHDCYLICPMLISDGDRTYNSAVLIDRQGRIAGQYNKIRPTENELRKGICPGASDPPVFETDFGRIGIQICFDVNWHQQWQTLEDKGAEIVFFASAYPAARQVRTLAWLHQYYVVSATLSRTSSILDVTGETLASTGKYQQWAGAVLPLGKTIFEIDFHISKIRKIQQKYGPRVEVAWYHDDDLLTLASLDPELTVEDLIQEYELTPHRDYILRAQEQQDELRQKNEP
jgi:predicted amidohydrolase